MTLARTFCVFALLTLVIAGTGCAVFGPKRSRPDNTPIRADNIKMLEKELDRVRSDHVLIPTRLLKTVLSDSKLHAERYRDLTEQLNAIKIIDLEERGSAYDSSH